MEELLAESPESGLPVESNALGTESQDDVGAEADTEAISGSLPLDYLAIETRSGEDEQTSSGVPGTGDVASPNSFISGGFASMSL
nr:unnamed protein product [Digitaria exilis]CAB3503290.1 unnamed protein product [Digitaria exilis]CAB3503714.1 unnamed protein product [Digitaria exilis]CAB3503731.1 unnamed protein product [Digitaria exilis]CAB3503958.1 unnamed protein product [Digitaria exilis]